MAHSLGKGFLLCHILKIQSIKTPYACYTQQSTADRHKEVVPAVDSDPNTQSLLVIPI